MIAAYIGDLVVTMTSHPSLDPNDPIPYHYTLHFRDVTNGECAELAFPGEDAAYKAFAAWLVADDDNIGILEPHRTKLVTLLPKGFMP